MIRPSEIARGDCPKSDGHVPALDGVRGLAVLIVFLVHYGGGQQSANPVLKTIGQGVQLGWAGVTLFFVLSGFLITNILWTSRGSRHWWRTFALRRALRIFPLYYFTLAIIAVCAWFRGTLGAGLHNLLVYAVYAQNINFDGHMPEIVPMEVFHYWSLAVEEQFYLVWPFILLATRSLRQARWLCVGTVAGSLLFRIWIEAAHRMDALAQSTPAHSGELAIGAWLALTLIEQPGWLPKARPFAAPVFMVSLAGALLCGGWTRNYRLDNPPVYVAAVLALSFAAAALLVLALSAGRVARFFSLTPLRHLGTISYGVYVYHVFLRFLFEDITGHLVPVTGGSRNTYNLVRLLVAAVITLTAAELSFRYIERPFLGLKNRIAPTQTVHSASNDALASPLGA